MLEAGGIYGKYNGFVQAFDDKGTWERGRVAVFLEPERFPVEVNVTGGDASTNYGNLLIVPMDNQTYLHDDPLTLPGEEQTTVGLYAGAYAIATSVTWSVDGVAQTGLLVAPEVTVDGPTTVTLDLADLEKVEVGYQADPDLRRHAGPEPGLRHRGLGPDRGAGVHVRRRGTGWWVLRPARSTRAP